MIVNGPVSSYVLPDLTHILREDSETASILNYNRLRPKPVSEMFLTHLTDWLRARQ